MEAAQISDDTPTSFAKECICLCSAESRKMNVITHKKNKKREESRKILENFMTTRSMTPHKKYILKRKQKDLIRAQDVELCHTITFDLITALVQVNVLRGEFLVFAPLARNNCTNPGFQMYLRVNKRRLQKIKIVCTGICFRV